MRVGHQRETDARRKMDCDETVDDGDLLLGMAVEETQQRCDTTSLLVPVFRVS
jgi:hypothetical protein